LGHRITISPKDEHRSHEGAGHELLTQHAEALNVALSNSCALVAAYCRADALPEELITDFPGRLACAGDGQQSDWQLRRSAKRQKILIALVRASSDGVFVGTVDHVMVHPEVRGQGLGRRWDLLTAPVPSSYKPKKLRCVSSRLNPQVPVTYSVVTAGC
jgi:hypothetical protein